jgi:hypothetical protein
MIALSQAKQNNLLPMPVKGTDQLTMLETAVVIYKGGWPQGPYGYSPSYTLLLIVYIFLSGGNLYIMRGLQAVLCALIPLVTYKLCRRCRFDFETSQISALLLCFYGPLALISLSFLRAGPLALCFALWCFFILKAYMRKKTSLYIAGGFWGAMCVLGRENFAPIILFIPLFFLISKKIRGKLKAMHFVSYFGALFLSMLPVLLYNYIRFDSFSVVPGHVGNVLGAYHGQEAVNNFSAAIASILKNMPVQLNKFISSFELQNSLSFYAHREFMDVLWILFLPFNLLAGFGILGAYFKRKNPGVIFIALSAAAYVGTMIFFDMFYRFRIPTVPLMALLAGAGIAGIYKMRNSAKIALPLIFVIVFFFLTYTNPNKLIPKQEKINLIKVLIKTGRYEKAERKIIELEKTGERNDALCSELIRAMLKNNERNEAEQFILKLQTTRSESSN